MTEAATERKGLLRSFPATYWVVISMEFFERTAFYGMTAMLAAYFVKHVGSEAAWGAWRTVLYCSLYFVPVFSGALAEQVGYRKVLAAAFVLMTAAYLGLGSFTSLPMYYLFMILLGVGGGLFKPVVSGTIARVTDEGNSTLGFGIYYWTINVGSFLASLVTTYFAQRDAASGGNELRIVFFLSAGYVALMFFNNLFFYREPRRPAKAKTVRESWNNILTVCGNWRFLLLLLVFSGFWGVWDRSTDAALWLVESEYMDFTPVNDFVTRAFAFFGSDYRFTFTVANVTTINAAVIILFQVLASWLTRRTRPLPTMMAGLVMVLCFPLLTAFSRDPWVFVLSLVLLSLGEITAYPKLISYVGLIAPRDKVAIYMGFLFLPIFFSSMIYSYPFGALWKHLVADGGGWVTAYWLVVAGLGFLTLLGLLCFHLFVGKKLSMSERKGG